jgi:hypothetical protein
VVFIQIDKTKPNSLFSVDYEKDYETMDDRILDGLVLNHDDNMLIS